MKQESLFCINIDRTTNWSRQNFFILDSLHLRSSSPLTRLSEMWTMRTAYPSACTNANHPDTKCASRNPQILTLYLTTSHIGRSLVHAPLETHQDTLFILINVSTLELFILPHKVWISNLRGSSADWTELLFSWLTTLGVAPLSKLLFQDPLAHAVHFHKVTNLKQHGLELCRIIWWQPRPKVHQKLLCGCLSIDVTHEGDEVTDVFHQLCVFGIHTASPDIICSISCSWCSSSGKFLALVHAGEKVFRWNQTVAGRQHHTSCLWAVKQRLLLLLGFYTRCLKTHKRLLSILWAEARNSHKFFSLDFWLMTDNIYTPVINIGAVSYWKLKTKTQYFTSTENF